MDHVQKTNLKSSILLFGAILSVNDNGRRSGGVGLGNCQVLCEIAIVSSYSKPLAADRCRLTERTDDSGRFLESRFL